MSHHGRNVSKPESAVPSKVDANAPVDPHVQEIARTETNRPVKAGGGKHRGDRRDMSQTYTTTEKHSARGNTPRKDVSTRAR